MVVFTADGLSAGFSVPAPLSPGGDGADEGGRHFELHDETRIGVTAAGREVLRAVPLAGEDCAVRRPRRRVRL